MKIPLDRLTQAIPPPNLQRNPAAPEEGKLPIEAYSYDPVHNRLSSQHQPGAWQYNADNQLLGYGVGSEQITLSYSTNGHTTREVTGNPAAPLKVRDYRYNAAERLTEIDDNGQAIGRYRYDPMGRRVYKETATETTWFIYADEGLIAELQADGTLKRGYGWKPQGLWGTDPLWLADKTDAAQSDWSTHIYHNDHLWTSQRLTDSAGVVSWSGRSEAFGLTTATVNIVDNPLRFPGQYEDWVGGGNYNYFRDYKPGAARYLQSDAFGLEGGLNMYIYVDGSPLHAFDFMGLSGSRDDGPYHPPKGVKTKCRKSDLCPALIAKTWVLARMITSHAGWDAVMPWPRGGGRHAGEIAELWTQYKKCISYAFEKCKDACKRIIRPRLPIIPIMLDPCLYSPYSPQCWPSEDPGWA